MSDLTDLKKLIPNTIGGSVLPDRKTDAELGLGSFKTINIGSGAESLRANREGFWLGAETFASAPFRVDMSGNLTATAATISGSITATTGEIAGWTVGSATLSKNNATLDSDGALTLGTSNDIVKLSSVDSTYRLWIGHATAASAPFRVTKAGAVTATNATLTGNMTLNDGNSILCNAGGDIYLTESTTNPSEIRWRDATNPATEYWSLAKNNAFSSETLTFNVAGYDAGYFYVNATRANTGFGIIQFDGGQSSSTTADGVSHYFFTSGGVNLRLGIEDGQRYAELFELRLDGRLDVSSSGDVGAISVSISASSGGYTDVTHNFGGDVFPIFTKDQTDGGYLDYVEVAYQVVNSNTIRVYYTNRNASNTATGSIRYWILKR